MPRIQSYRRFSNAWSKSDNSFSPSPAARHSVFLISAFSVHSISFSPILFRHEDLFGAELEDIVVVSEIPIGFSEVLFSSLVSPR